MQLAFFFEAKSLNADWDTFAVAPRRPVNLALQSFSYIVVDFELLSFGFWKRKREVFGIILVAD